jgi:DNA-binding NtrC family response regulator
LIRSAGLRAKTFTSAQEFLASPPAEASCLVLDVELPGLSGLDLQQELAKADVQIPIIFLTGRGDIPMTVRAIKAGALEFLTKPFDDEDLLKAIRQAIARSRTARQQGGNSAQGNLEGIVDASAACRGTRRTQQNGPRHARHSRAGFHRSDSAIGSGRGFNLERPAEGG